MKKLVFAFIAVALLQACGGVSDNDVKETKMQVMEVHDRVMPLMGTMGALEKKLRLSSEGSDDSLNLINKATDLRVAHDAMMDWMHAFSDNYNEEWTNEEKMTFLKAEKAKMEAIEAQTNAAIEAAE